LGNIASYGDVSERKLGSPRGVNIEADNAPSAVDEISRYRASHNAKPDDSNGPVHESSFLPIEFD
jgi:hypothetical protein